MTLSPSVPRFSASAASRASRKQREVDAEAAVRRLGAADRLEDEIDRRAIARCGERGGDVGQHAGLRRDSQPLAQLVEQVAAGRGSGRAVARRVDADDGVAAAEQQPIDDAGGDALADRRSDGSAGAAPRAVRQADRVAKPRHDPAFRGDRDEILQPQSLETAAAISGVRPGASAASVSPVAASDSSQSRKPRRSYAPPARRRRASCVSRMSRVTSSSS